jgi:hypothetical protein
MHNDDMNRSDDVRAIEQSLRGLTPANTLVNRDRLMYEAGWAAREAATERAAAPQPAAAITSGKRDSHRWLWPATSAALLLVSATLAAVLITREPEKQIVYAYVSPLAKGANEQAEPDEGRNVAADASKTQSDLPWLSVLQSFGTATPRADANYLTLRSRVLAFGVDVLPSTAVPRGASDSRADAPRYGEMRGALLGG